jgi:predicted  nucleic acid-binding Zn-ribbon protein
VAIRYSPQVPASVWSTALRDRRDAEINLNVRLHEETIRRDAIAKELDDARDRESAELRRRSEALTQAVAHAEELRRQLAQQAAEFAERNGQVAREMELTRASSREQTVQLERTIEEWRTRSAEELRQAVAHEAKTSQRLNREIQAHEETHASLAAASSRLAADLEARAREREVTEEKHAELVECLHAQNARLLDVEYRAAMVCRELDQAQAEISRLNATIANVSQRLFVRLDRKASRLLAAKTRQELPV